MGGKNESENRSPHPWSIVTVRNIHIAKQAWSFADHFRLRAKHFSPTPVEARHRASRKGEPPFCADGRFNDLAFCLLEDLGVRHETVGALSRWAPLLRRRS